MSLIIVGAGGFGREVLTYAQDAGLSVAGFLDDNPQALAAFGMSALHLGPLEDFTFTNKHSVLIAVGEPNVRRKWAHKVQMKGGRLQTLIHPTAYVARSAILEDGCILCPLALVGAYATVGANSVINTYASVGHDAKVGAHSVFSPYSVINGNVILGESVFLGTHASVTPGKIVGLNSKISAGSVVSRNIEAGSLAMGNPAQGRVMFPTILD